MPVDRAGPAYAELALMRGDPSDGLPGVPGVGEKTAATLLAQHGSLEQILAAAHDPKSKMSKAYRTKLLAATDYIEAAGPVVQVATDAPVTLSTPSDTLPLAAEHPRKVAKLAEAYGVTSSIGRLQKALDGLPALTRLLGPADLVGAVVVLERHRHLALGAVDADLAVEGVTLFHRGALAVVALDVLDVLGAVAVGLVGQDLLHPGLRGADVQLGGDEEARLPEAEHQHHGDDDRGQQADDAADDRQRALGALFGAGARAVLPVLPWLLAVLTRLLAVLTGLLAVLRARLLTVLLAVLTGLLSVLTGRRVRRRAVLAGLLAELLGRRVLLLRRLVGRAATAAGIAGTAAVAGRRPEAAATTAPRWSADRPRG